MSKVKILRPLREGYQPVKNDLTKGYPVNQQVDLSNLKLPSSLRGAAVAPNNSSRQVPSASKTEK